MAEIINFNQARKAKAAAEARATAEANRRKFGQTKAEKAAETARQALADKALDGHRLNEPADDSSDEPDA